MYTATSHLTLRKYLSHSIRIPSLLYYLQPWHPPYPTIRPIWRNLSNQERGLHDGAPRRRGEKAEDLQGEQTDTRDDN
jgi:hypothetical protein